MSGEEWEHLAWAEPLPDDATRGTVQCICQFESVVQRMRDAEMYAVIHESGIAGLPGTKIKEVAA